MFFFANLAVIKSPLITEPLDHYTLVNMYIAFVNIMACRVFRGVALGMLHMENTPSGLSTTRIARALRSNERQAVENYPLEVLVDDPS